MKDQLGDRIKANYENRARTSLMRRCYTIIRLDGKAFHTYCRGLEKPFDDGLMEDMDLTAAYLCKHIMGAKFAFIQSDEISILMTDFETKGASSWFDSDVQKVCSVSASMATRAFNEARLCRLGPENMKWAEFDSRVFQIADRKEVENVFIWRQQDTTRNSISMVAQSMYSHKELHGKSSDRKQEMIFQKSGINWNNYAPRYKRGRIVVNELYEKPAENESSKPSLRSRWVAKDVPIFTQQREFLEELIPELRIRETAEVA
jgi:tRNA(His) 5'-end guanylyltransferase